MSNLLASELTFADGQVRQIEDILFRPETGEVQDYVVEMSPDAVLSTDERRVPADWVRADANGGLRVTQPATYQYEVWII